MQEKIYFNTAVITGVLTLGLLCGQVYTQTRQCDKTVRDPASIWTPTWYSEALLGSDFSLECTVCKYKLHHVQVFWSLAGVRLVQSSRLHSYQKHPEKHILRVRQATSKDMGNYTCAVENMEGKVTDYKTIIVDKAPQPPSFVPEPDRVNSSSQLLTWTGKSGLPIIQYLLEFRLSPMSGVGEDWVSLVIPYQASPQSYLMRGLSPGTTYQARIRTKTRNGISHFSTLLKFTTYTPWTTIPTTTRPNTIFSLPQTADDLHSKYRDTMDTSRAKELSSFSNGVEVRLSGSLLVIGFYTVFNSWI